MPGQDGQSNRTKAILTAIGKHRDEAQAEGQHFTTLTDAGIDEKIKGQKPLIVWQSWTPSVTVGNTLICDVGLANPGPTKHANLFATMTVGFPAVTQTPHPPGLDPRTSMTDARFPRLTLPRFEGLPLEPGEVRSLRFAMTTPGSVDRSNYFASIVLIQAAWHGQGDHLDQSLFIFEVV
ncbi:MAG: hypothetical protein M3314_13260 [Actinomycetota bacterium]|nr:hypothetical protein [Actinomycetota bacterium]